MYFPLLMLWETIPMSIYLCLYSVFSMSPPLYSHPNWDYMIYHKPYLQSPFLFILKLILRLIVLLYYPSSMFLSTLSRFLIFIVGFQSMDKSSLMNIGTSHDPLLSVQFILPLSVQLDVIHMPSIYILYHTSYLLLLLYSCIFPNQLLVLHTLILFLVTVALSVKCVHLLSTSLDIGSKSRFLN